jgi:hypothetical protein
MPDKWGRVTGDDFFSVANAFASINNSIQRGKQTEISQENLAISQDRNSREEERHGWAREEQQRSQKEFARQDQARGLANDMLSYWDKNGPVEMPRGDTNPLLYNQALGIASQSYHQSDAGKQLIMETRKTAHARDYGIFREYQAGILDAYGRGDMETTTTLIEKMSEAAPIPYKYQFDKESGMFNELYLDSQTDEWQQTGQVPVADVLSRIKATGEKEFAMESFRAKEATRQWNEDAWMNKTAVAQKDGKTFYVTPQKDPNSPNQVHYHVVDDQNHEVIYKSSKEMARSGIRLEDLERKKKVSEINSINALTGERTTAAMANRALIGKRDAERDLALHKIKKADEGEEKFVEWKFYDPKSGREYAAKSQEQYDYYESQGMSPIDKSKKAPTKAEIDQYERSADAFGLETKDLGIFKDEETGHIGGTVRREDWESVAKKARHHGLQLMTKQGQPIDSNGWWPGGDVQTVDIQVMPYGTTQDSSGAAIGAEFDKGGNKYGFRVDGSPKGDGFLGPLKTPDGSVATEVSIGVNIDGKETLIPTLVPTLTQDEIQTVLKGGNIPQPILDKAVAHAKERMAAGKSPFADQEGAGGGKQKDTAAMGRKPAITQMTEEEIKGLATWKRYGKDVQASTTPLTVAQKFIGRNHHPDFEHPGEGKIEAKLRQLGIESDLQKQKEIAKMLQRKFPDATEEQIIAMLKKSVEPDTIK